jgi:hypothetical protein
MRTVEAHTAERGKWLNSSRQAMEYKTANVAPDAS